MAKKSDDKNEGWISLHRKVMESTVWQNETVWRVWCWCLLKANHEVNKIPFNGEDIIIKRGQFITGRAKALKEMRHLTARSYRTCINYLKTTSRITIKATNKFSIITICKYDDYQNQKIKSDQPENKKRPTSDQQTTTNNNDINNYNKGSEEKRKINVLNDDTI